MRNVSDTLIHTVDAHAQECGVTHSEEQHDCPAQHVTVEDLRRFSETYADLADDGVMREAW